MKPRTFRLDIGEREEASVVSSIESWLSRNSDTIYKYLIFYEIAEETKKPHYQGIMYVDDKVKFENIARFWKDYKPSEKSFAPVRDEKSYRKYCKKDGDIRFRKGITDEEMESWGDWDKELNKKQKLKGRREDFYMRFIEFCKLQEEPFGKVYTLAWIGTRLFEFISKEPQPELVNWYKGVIFSAQAVLMINHPNHDKKDVIVNEWVQRVMY